MPVVNAYTAFLVRKVKTNRLFGVLRCATTSSAERAKPSQKLDVFRFGYRLTAKKSAFGLKPSTPASDWVLSLGNCGRMTVVAQSGHRELSPVVNRFALKLAVRWQLSSCRLLPDVFLVPSGCILTRRIDSPDPLPSFKRAFGQ